MLGNANLDCKRSLAKRKGERNSISGLSKIGDLKLLRFIRISTCIGFNAVFSPYVLVIFHCLLIPGCNYVVISSKQLKEVCLACIVYSSKLVCTDYFVYDFKQFKNLHLITSFSLLP